MTEKSCPNPELPRFFGLAGAIERRRQKDLDSTHVVVECECRGWHVVPVATIPERGAA
jgi:hypothetical protein